MEEHVRLLAEQKLPIPLPNSNLTIVIQNEQQPKIAVAA